MNPGRRPEGDVLGSGCSYELDETAAPSLVIGVRLQHETMQKGLHSLDCSHQLTPPTFGSSLPPQFVRPHKARCRWNSEHHLLLNPR